MTDQTEKMVLIGTHGAEDPVRATLPFVIANAALAMDVKAVVILQGLPSVQIAMKGANEHIFTTGFPPLKELMDSFFGQGGELLVCTPCMTSQKYTSEMLVEGAVMVAGARVVQECLEAKAVLNY